MYTPNFNEVYTKNNHESVVDCYSRSQAVARIADRAVTQKTIIVLLLNSISSCFEDIDL